MLAGQIVVVETGAISKLLKPDPDPLKEPTNGTSNNSSYVLSYVINGLFFWRGWERGGLPFFGAFRANFRGSQDMGLANRSLQNKSQPAAVEKILDKATDHRLLAFEEE